ncbi:hypothetical protein DIPPA_27873 [Diplonema papillatum]|nr:hypothetical protein DIPPA_27873 [Diplonema papillatum]
MSLAFAGSVVEVRLWSSVRSLQDIDACRRHFVGPRHKDLLGYWRLTSDLLDSSGWNRHMRARSAMIWDEVHDVAWTDSVAVSRLVATIDAAPKCSLYCTEQMDLCTAWTWDSAAGACRVTDVPSTELEWRLAPGAQTGRFKACAALRWQTTVGSALASLPHPLPAASDDPYYWYAALVSSARACAAACHQQKGCTVWTWARHDSGCYLVRDPSWAAEKDAAFVSGSQVACGESAPVVVFERMAAAADAAAAGEAAKEACARRHAAPVAFRGPAQIAALRQALLSDAWAATEPAYYPLALIADGRVVNFAAEDITHQLREPTGTASGTSELPSELSDALATGEVHVVGLYADVGQQSNASLAAWKPSAVGTAAYAACEISGMWSLVPGVSVAGGGSAACSGGDVASCAEACVNGWCVSPGGPCECNAGFYPPGDCSEACGGGGDLVANGTRCAARPRLGFAAGVAALPAGGGRQHVPRSAAAFAMYHTTAVHLNATSAAGTGGPRHAIRVVRGGGRACAGPVAPASAAGPVTYMGTAPFADECAALADRREQSSEVAFLWSTDGRCFSTPRITNHGPGNDTFIGCQLRDGLTDDQRCATRPHSPWIIEPEVTAGATPRGLSELVYHVTAEQAGEFILCYNSLEEEESSWVSAGTFTVRVWTCAERKMLLPSTPCLP